MTAPSTRRVNRGRGHSYTIDGKPALGVTTILKAGLPKPALIGWAAREVAQAVIDRRDVLMDFSDAELMDFLRNAPGRKRDAAANRGTEVHKLAQRLAAGEEVEVPEELTGHVDSYLAFLDSFQPSNALLERPVFNRTHLYAGTIDLLADTPKLGKALFDVKTSGSGIYGEVALQLAAYGRAEFYVDDEFNEIPLPPIDSYAAVWVRADGFDVYPVEVTEREFKTFLYVAQVAWWLDHRAARVKGDAIWSRQEVSA